MIVLVSYGSSRSYSSRGNNSSGIVSFLVDGDSNGSVAAMVNVFKVKIMR